jgi:hypothetical protein
MKDYLIINRAKWRTGGNSITFNKTGEGSTALLNEEGYMCCLGFRCEQMGVPKKDLLHKPNPDSLSYDWDIPDLLDTLGNETLFTREAVRINDNISYTSQYREESITKHFATIGVTVEFKGKYK